MKTMKTWLQGGVMLLAVGLMLASMSVSMAPRDAAAATQNYAGVPLVTMPVHIDASTASASSVASIKVPAKMKLIGMSATARAASGVADTLTVNLRAGATPIIAAPLSVSSVAVSEATISTSTIADETTIHFDTALSANAAWYDITVLLTLLPL